MNDTNHMFLRALRDHPDDNALWDVFVGFYRPLLMAWLPREASKDAEGEDLVQDVLQTVMRELPKFEYNPARGRFRGWLRGILANRIRNHLRNRRREPVAGDRRYETIANQLEDGRSRLSQMWNLEYENQREQVQKLFATVKNDVSDNTWEIFSRLLEGQKPKAIAAELKITANAVYTAKSNVLRRLRRERAGEQA